MIGNAKIGEYLVFMLCGHANQNVDGTILVNNKELNCVGYMYFIFL
jgi:hypothetical protein